jgi:hypothetical protein
VDEQEKLEKLRKNSEFRENELKKCSNFDRQARVIQRRLDKLQKGSKDRSYSEDTAEALQHRLEKLVLAACSTAQSVSSHLLVLSFTQFCMNSVMKFEPVLDFAIFSPLPECFM